MLYLGQGCNESLGIPSHSNPPLRAIYFRRLKEQNIARDTQNSSQKWNLNLWPIGHQLICSYCFLPGEIPYKWYKESGNLNLTLTTDYCTAIKLKKNNQFSIKTQSIKWSYNTQSSFKGTFMTLEKCVSALCCDLVRAEGWGVHSCHFFNWAIFIVYTSLRQACLSLALSLLLWAQLVTPCDWTERSQGYTCRFKSIQQSVWRPRA